MDQILEKTAASRTFYAGTVADHRSLVDNENCAGKGIVGYISHVAQQSAFRSSVDAPMDCRGWETREPAEDFGCTPCRSEQNDRHFSLTQRTDQRTCQKRLARSGIAAEQENGIGRSRGRTEPRERGHQLDLLIGRIVWQVEKNTLGKLMGIHREVEGCADRKLFSGCLQTADAVGGLNQTMKIGRRKRDVKRVFAVRGNVAVAVAEPSIGNIEEGSALE